MQTKLASHGRCSWNEPILLLQRMPTSLLFPKRIHCFHLVFWIVFAAAKGKVHIYLRKVLFSCGLTQELSFSRKPTASIDFKETWCYWQRASCCAFQKQEIQLKTGYADIQQRSRRQRPIQRGAKICVPAHALT